MTGLIVRLVQQLSLPSTEIVTAIRHNSQLLAPTVASLHLQFAFRGLEALSLLQDFGRFNASEDPPQYFR